MRDILRIIVHHSASSLDTKKEDIEQWHLARGWNQIGYHGVVEGDGLYRTGRPIQLTGAHARHANQDSLGLCIVGDNTNDARHWTFEQMKTADKVLEVWLWMWPQAKVFGHCDVGATLCPGVDVRDVFARIRRGD